VFQQGSGQSSEQCNGPCTRQVRQSPLLLLTSTAIMLEGWSGSLTSPNQAMESAMASSIEM
jgi:hypothetical protein